MTTAIQYSIGEIYSVIGGKKYFEDSESPLEYLSLDSRKIIVPLHTVFWTLSSVHRNGSSFIEEVYKLGVRNFVTDSLPDYSKFPKANWIIVNETLDALQRLAACHRRRFKKIHVIAITGSNGKTVQKEWLFDFLSANHQVVKSPRSFNSQIGVALSLLQIRDYHTVGIFEAGIGRAGEMGKLFEMIQPDTGIFTNIGSAHDEGFKSRSQKISEKLRLFKKVKKLIYPSSIEQITREMKTLNPKAELLSWGRHQSFFKINAVRKINGRSAISIESPKRKISFEIPFTDDAYIENAISCYSALEADSYFRENLINIFSTLSSLPMRLELKHGLGNSNLINDTYSNDLQSLEVALDFLHQQTHSRKVVILSDILQSGLSEDRLYKRVSQLFRDKPVNLLIGIGGQFINHKTLFSFIQDSHFYKTTGDFVKQINKLRIGNSDILIKGARDFAFEKITNSLEAQVHQTRLTINLSHLIGNIGVYKGLLRPGVKMMMMVKAFAYGSGSREIASVLQFIKVDYLTVAYVDEGVSLRDAGIRLPIMVMNTNTSSFETLITHKLEPEIFSFNLLHQFAAFLNGKGIKEYPVHVKIDTGMHRLGFEPKQAKSLIESLIKNKSLKVKSVFSHLSASDDPTHDAFTMKQFRSFRSIVNKLRNGINYPFDCHIANSAVISRFPEFQMDMVRLGIGMYGIDSNPEISRQLRVVNTLTTTISQIRKVKAGDVVSYGAQKIEEDKTIATIGIGYADGYKRLLGDGKGKVWLQNKSALTVGRVCMDMTMIDVSRIPDVQEGDEVEIFGEHLPVTKVADEAGTIPYEIFTGISSRVKRVYIED